MAAKPESMKGAAFRKKLVTRFKPKESDAIRLDPSVVACHGQDIRKKSGHRKGKFLFSFPGLMSPMPGGGTIGTLDKLDTDKPVLYIEFPQGRLKMQGTVVYAQNRFLTLQCARSGKAVVCEDVFDAVVTFPEVAWIGPMDANPSETPLPMPSFLHSSVDSSPADAYTFGAGDYTCEDLTGSNTEETPPPPVRTTLERRSKTACLLKYSSALVDEIDDAAFESEGEFSPVINEEDNDEWEDERKKKPTPRLRKRRPAATKRRQPGPPASPTPAPLAGEDSAAPATGPTPENLIDLQDSPWWWLPDFAFRR